MIDEIGYLSLQLVYFPLEEINNSLILLPSFLKSHSFVTLNVFLITYCGEQSKREAFR
jgi:hypothetical protein